MKARRVRLNVQPRDIKMVPRNGLPDEALTGSYEDVILREEGREAEDEEQRSLGLTDE